MKETKTAKEEIVRKLRREDTKKLVIENPEFRAMFKDLIRGIANLYSFQSRTSDYTMSPERICIRRETERELLWTLVGKMHKMNKFCEQQFMNGYIRDFNKAQTKWDLLDEAYEMAMEWAAHDDEMFNILYPAFSLSA